MEAATPAPPPPPPPPPAAGSRSRATTRSASRPQNQGEYNRFLPLIKWLLAFPHYIVLFFLRIGALSSLLIAFFAIHLHRALAARALRLRGRQFTLGLPGVRLRLPAHRPVPAVLARGRPDYPVRVEFDYPEHVDRWRPLVHWLLILPYVFVAGILIYVARHRRLHRRLRDPVHGEAAAGDVQPDPQPAALGAARRAPTHAWMVTRYPPFEWEELSRRHGCRATRPGP